MRTIRKMSAFLKPYWVLAVITPLFMVLEVAMDLMQPRLMARIVDQGIANLDMPLILSTGLLMVGVALIGLCGGVGNTIGGVRVAMAVGADVRSALYRKLQSFSFGNLDHLGTGELVTRLTNDVTQIQDVTQIFLRILVRAPLLVVGSMVMAVVTSPNLSWLVFIVIPLISGILVWGIWRTYPIFGQLQKRLDRMNTVMQENLAGVRVVKAFVRGDHEVDRFKASNQDLVDAGIKVAQMMATVIPLMSMVMNLAIVGVVWFGGQRVMIGSLKVGQVMAFINYLSQMMGSILMVGMLLLRVSRARVSADRILEVLETEPLVQDMPNARTGLKPQGRVAFEHVSFSYNGQENAVLKDVNLQAEPGQMVAILGTTGSGKSSLIHLIPRFYDVTSGRVTLDGVDVRELSNEELRRKVGIALQETVLFSGTIRDNIRYGRPEATEEEVVAAAKAAQAHDFISALPEGYDTQLGQRGANLSGGQKQRIAIARALLVRPTVLILDDSTSAVDVDTEGRIQDALVEIMRGRTSFVVAQRISTVLNADKILVLDDGRIAAEGTHSELMASSPIYREIYDLQLGNGVAHG